MPLQVYDNTPAEACPGCKYRFTKPEWIPVELLDGVATALGLAEKKANGARFDYPDGLSVFEWMTLDAINRGSSRAESERRKRAEAKNRRTRK